MTIAESLRYWLGYRLSLWAANRLAEIAAHNAPPMPPPQVQLPLPLPPPADDGPTQTEFAWQ